MDIQVLHHHSAAVGNNPVRMGSYCNAPNTYWSQEQQNRVKPKYLIDFDLKFYILVVLRLFLYRIPVLYQNELLI